MKHKDENIDRYDFIWIAHNMVNQLPNLIPLLRKGGIMVVELQKYIVESRDENLQSFVADLKSIMQKNGLHEISDIDAKEHCISRFSK